MAAAVASASSLHVSKLFSVAGKVAVVTGGGRGIGRMIAEGFVANGARVYICSRHAKTLEATARELSVAAGGTCVALAHDLSTDAGCRALAADMRARERAVHVLVNNSGVAWGATLEDYPEAAWDRVMALNLKAVFQLTRALLPLLDAASAAGDPARVINIGSIVGVRPQPFPTYAYDASKAAVHSLTVKLAGELADRGAAGGHGITVNAIAPGIVPSRMSRQLEAYAPSDALAAAVPLRRLGAPGDMAGAALFLASPAGAWVTGVVLPVDGGALAAPIAMAPDAKL
jgi:NAD(P)-dependent dehydrogenase (short-subunit alcohol dehydrogenase family)